MSSAKCWQNCSSLNEQTRWNITFVECSRTFLVSWLTQWGRLTHICVGKLTIIGSDSGLSPGRTPSHYLNQMWNIVIWNLRNRLQRNFDRSTNIFTGKIRWKMLSVKCCPFRLCLNVFRGYPIHLTIACCWRGMLHATSENPRKRRMMIKFYSPLQRAYDVEIWLLYLRFDGTSHGRHGVLNRASTIWLFVQCLVQARNKENAKVPH